MSLTEGRVKYFAEQIIREIESTADKCQNPKCRKLLERGDDYRCWDCKAIYCGECVKHHFGQQHQPHPLLLSAIHKVVAELVEDTKHGHTPKEHWSNFVPVDYDEAVAAMLYRAEDLLKRLPER